MDNFPSRPEASDTTLRGFAADEVRSALQKSIRPGLLEQAVLAAYELFSSGPEMEDGLWRRLEIIAAEDDRQDRAFDFTAVASVSRRA